MKSKFVVAAMLLAGVSSVSAAELLASVESVKGGAAAIGFDLVSDGSVAGFSFSIDVGGAEAKSIRSGNCVSQLPKGFTASCGYGAGKLHVMAFADVPGTFIPAGVTPVGSITVASPLAKASGVRISNFETSNDNGVSTPGTAKVDGVDVGDMAADAAAK